MSKFAKMVVCDGDTFYEDRAGNANLTKFDALSMSFGFCGCGRPQDALLVVRNTLRLSAMKFPEEGDHTNWYTTVLRPAIDKVFHGDSGLEYFVRYRLDDLELTEHGGGVGSAWLSALGVEVLAELESLDLDAIVAD